jgi:hypothetical protein
MKPRKVAIVIRRTEEFVRRRGQSHVARRCVHRVVTVDFGTNRPRDGRTRSQGVRRWRTYALPGLRNALWKATEEMRRPEVGGQTDLVAARARLMDVVRRPLVDLLRVLRSRLERGHLS